MNLVLHHRLDTTDFLLPSSTKAFEMLQRILSAALIIVLTAPLSWSAEHNVKLVKDGSGWKMVVDGDDFYVKGFTWSHCPVGMKHDYGEIVLTKEWKEHSFSVEGKDLRRIKNPFTVVVSGNGFPFRFYLDDVSYK